MIRSKRIRFLRLASIWCALATAVTFAAFRFGESLGLPIGIVETSFIVSLVVFAVGLGLQAAYQVARRRGRRKGRPCVHCGYDLRGNTSGICPECGGLAHYKRSRR